MRTHAPHRRSFRRCRLDAERRRDGNDPCRRFVYRGHDHDFPFCHRRAPLTPMRRGSSAPTGRFHNPVAPGLGRFRRSATASGEGSRMSAGIVAAASASGGVTAIAATGSITDFPAASAAGSIPAGLSFDFSASRRLRRSNAASPGDRLAGFQTNGLLYVETPWRDPYFATAPRYHHPSRGACLPIAGDSLPRIRLELEPATRSQFREELRVDIPAVSTFTA